MVPSRARHGRACTTSSAMSCTNEGWYGNGRTICRGRPTCHYSCLTLGCKLLGRGPWAGTAILESSAGWDGRHVNPVSGAIFTGICVYLEEVGW